MLCRVGADDENTDFDLYTEQGQVIRRGAPKSYGLAHHKAATVSED